MSRLYEELHRKVIKKLALFQNCVFRNASGILKEVLLIMRQIPKFPGSINSLV